MLGLLPWSHAQSEENTVNRVSDLLHRSPPQKPLSPLDRERFAQYGSTENAINGRADSAGTASARPKPSPWQRKLRSYGAHSQIGIRRLQGPVILV